MVTTDDKSLGVLPGTLRVRFTVYDNCLDDRLLYHRYKTPTALYYPYLQKARSIVLHYFSISMNIMLILSLREIMPDWCLVHSYR